MAHRDEEQVADGRSSHKADTVSQIFNCLPCRVHLPTGCDILRAGRDES